MSPTGMNEPHDPTTPRSVVRIEYGEGQLISVTLHVPSPVVKITLEQEDLTTPRSQEEEK